MKNLLKEYKNLFTLYRNEPVFLGSTLAVIILALATPTMKVELPKLIGAVTFTQSDAISTIVTFIMTNLFISKNFRDKIFKRLPIILIIALILDFSFIWFEDLQIRAYFAALNQSTFILMISRILGILLQRKYGDDKELLEQISSQFSLIVSAIGILSSGVAILSARYLVVSIRMCFFIVWVSILSQCISIYISWLQSRKYIIAKKHLKSM